MGPALEGDLALGSLAIPGLDNKDPLGLCLKGVFLLGPVNAVRSGIGGTLDHGLMVGSGERSLQVGESLGDQVTWSPSVTLTSTQEPSLPLRLLFLQPSAVVIENPLRP